MKGLKAKFSKLIQYNPQLFSVLSIGLLSFLIFYVLFKQVSADDYLREIIAALIATILTVTITTLLLKSQTESEEAKERNVEILRRKIDSYNVFIDSIIDTMDQDEVTEDEAKAIRKQVYHLSLFSAPDTVQEVVHYVRGHLLGDVEETDFIDVVQAFRQELKLDTSDELLGADLEAVDKLIGQGFSNREVFFAVRDYAARMQEEIAGALAAGRDLTLTAEPPYGSLSGMEFHFTNANAVTYIVHVDYPPETEFTSIPAGLFIELGDAAPQIAKVAADAATGRDFEWDCDEGETPPFDQLVRDHLLEKHFDMACRRGAKQALVINGKAVVNRIVADIEALERQLPTGGKG